MAEVTINKEYNFVEAETYDDLVKFLHSSNEDLHDMIIENVKNQINSNQKFPQKAILFTYYVEEEQESIDVITDWINLPTALEKVMKVYRTAGRYDDSIEVYNLISKLKSKA